MPGWRRGVPQSADEPMGEGLDRQLESRAIHAHNVDAGIRRPLAGAAASRSSAASVLDENNNRSHVVSLDAATIQGLCFFVDVRDDMLAVDFDDADSVGRAPP